MASPATASRRAHPWLLVAGGGLLAGALDIVFACGTWWLKAGVPPHRILQSIAAGLLGKASFEGGTTTAALGLALHFFIALTMSAAYYLAARRWPRLRQLPVPFGAGYGVLLYGLMNFVVVPLSAAEPAPNEPLWITLDLLAHVALIGIPIALFARRAHRR